VKRHVGPSQGDTTSWYVRTAAITVIASARDSASQRRWIIEWT
jgi:hypothetical protein